MLDFHLNNLISICLFVVTHRHVLILLGSISMHGSYIIVLSIYWCKSIDTYIESLWVLNIFSGIEPVLLEGHPCYLFWDVCPRLAVRSHNSLKYLCQIRSDLRRGLPWFRYILTVALFNYPQFYPHKLPSKQLLRSTINFRLRRCIIEFSKTSPESDGIHTIAGRTIWTRRECLVKIQHE